MWWYRDTKGSPSSKKRGALAAPAATAAATAAPATGLAVAVGTALAGRPRDPEAFLLMSLLVDSRIELADGTATDGMTWFAAEQTIAAALGGEPVRLYNRFSKDFGDGYSVRTDVSAEHRAALDRLRAALAAAASVKSVAPRTPREAAAVESGSSS